ncbi:MAG: hypothetical protein HQK49_04880 [Oligoflexia bacterium]|nr:hypothetical protein [Oligoflexia bacterium]
MQTSSKYQNQNQNQVKLIEWFLKKLPIPAIYCTDNGVVKIANEKFLALAEITEITDLNFLKWSRKFISDNKIYEEVISSFKKRVEVTIEMPVLLKGIDVSWVLSIIPISKNIFENFEDIDGQFIFLKKGDVPDEYYGELEKFAYDHQKKAAELKMANQELTRVSEQLRLSMEKEKEMAVLEARADTEQKKSEELREANRRLEQKEHDLQEKLLQVEGFNRIMVGRELEMIKLKNEINTLLVELGRAKKYADHTK